MQKDTNFDFSALEPGDRLKYEVAAELGLLDQVRTHGWKSLSSKETGQIGGIVSRRRKALEAENSKMEL